LVVYELQRLLVESEKGKRHVQMLYKSTCANPIPNPRRKKLELMVRQIKLEVETKTETVVTKSNARKETW